MVDRVGLLLPHLSRAAAGEEIQLREALRDLRLGVGIAELRQLNPQISAAAEQQIQSALASLAAHFNGLAAGRPAAVPSSVVSDLDAAITGILQAPDRADRYTGISAAISIRLALFPQAPAYRTEKATA